MEEAKNNNKHNWEIKIDQKIIEELKVNFMKI